MILVYILLLLSVLLNLLFFIFDVMPYLAPALERRFKKQTLKGVDVIEIEKRIVDASIAAIKRKKSIMTWSSDNLYLRLQSIHRVRMGREFKNYNYPRAYLMYGISAYLIKARDEARLNELKHYFDKHYIFDTGQPRFHVNKVDQAIFGIVAIHLFTVYKENKYRVFCKQPL